MSLPPPPALVELMERLGVATSAQMLRAGRAIRRAARELQQFDSVWIDALVRTRRLTPFQAREINAGRGELLKIGPYLLCEKLAGPPYLLTYRAKKRESGAMVRLAIVRRTGFQPCSRTGFKPVALDHQENPNAGISVGQIGNLSYDSGVEGDRLYFAAPWVVGRSVAQHLIFDGRFSPEIVREIARSMIGELAALEKAGGCHGDIAPWNLLLTSEGDCLFINAGLRGILRPEEGFAFAELLPEAYDYLAPERVAGGVPPDISSDIYACGCVWWQMLCGRPPLGGGDSLTKLRAAQTAAIPDVRRFAPETPATLADAIAACLQKEPGRRPESLAKLGAMLGPPQKGSRQFVARTMVADHRSHRLGERHLRRQSLRRNWPVWLTVIVGCISAALLLLGPTFKTLTERANSGKNVTRHRGAVRQSFTKNGQVGNPPRGIQNRQVGNLSHGRLDRQVRPAGYNGTEKPLLPRRPATPDYLLETKLPQPLEAFSLQRGQRVIGRLGRARRSSCPQVGLKLDGEEIRLENLDFCWKAGVNPNAGAAMILYAGSRAEFRGCRFIAAKEASVRPAVICWTNGAGKEKIALPSGGLQFTNCIFHGVGTAIDSRRRGAIALNLQNCLLQEMDGLLHLDRQPELDEPLSLHLTKLTMQKTGPLLNCRLSPSEKPPGEIAVQAESCVFSPRKNEPLLAFEGNEPPGALLRNIRWDGTGSLVAAETAVGAWKTPAERWEPLDDSTLAIAGMVRSRLEFAEDLEKGGEKAVDNADPAQSARLLRWQAPQPTLDPPGVDGDLLPKGSGKMKDQR